MDVFTWVWLSLFTSFLGAVAGFGFATRKVLVVWYHLVGILLATFLISSTSSFMGGVSKNFLSVRFLEVMLGLVLMMIALLLLFSRPSYPGIKDFGLLFLAVQSQVIFISVANGQTAGTNYGLALTLALLLLGGLVGGLIIGGQRWANWRVRMMLPYVPSFLYFLVGLVKVF